MKVEDAKKLKYGQRVQCPEDGTSPGFIGTVRTLDHVIAGSNVYKNIKGQEYIWIEVQDRDPNKRRAVWPSNRLEVA